jgi:hypothetical protein
MSQVSQVEGRGRTIKTAFTRPNDTTQYTSGDVVNDSTSAPSVMTFSGFSSTAGKQTLIQQLIVCSSANQSTKLDAELWLFDTTVTPDNDNAAFTPTDAENRTLVAKIAIPASAWAAGTATAGAGGNAVCVLDNLGIPVNTLVSDNAIYGVLVARNAYTPVAQEVFDFRLKLID